MTLLRLTSAVGVLLLASALGSPAGASSTAADPTLTVTYAGSASNTMTFTNPAGERPRTDEVTVSWRFRFVGPASKLSGAVPFTSQSAQGFFSQTYAAPNAALNCSYSLSAGAGNAMGVTPQGTTLVIDFAVPNRVQPGDPAAQLVGKNTSGASCSPLQGGLPVIGNWPTAPHPAAPRVTVDLGRRTARTWQFTSRRTWDDGRKNNYRLSSTVVVTPLTAAPIGAVTTPTQVRTLAARLMQETLASALYPCLTAATGAAVFAAGGPAIGPIVGGTMVAVAKPLCVQLVKDLEQLDLVVNDPPVPRYTLVATVPKVVSHPVGFVPCTRYPKAQQPLCARLQRAAQTWVDATRRRTAVLTTLAVTVGRESAAAKAGDAAALRKQQQAALALVAVARVADGAQLDAAGALGATLRSVGASGTLSAEHVERAIAVVRARLRAAGVGAARIEAIVNTSPTAGPIDVLARLGKT